MTPLVVLGCYLLLFRGDAIGKGRRRAVFAVTGLAVGCHPSHLGLMAGLLLAAALLKAVLFFHPLRPSPARAAPAADASLAGEAGLGMPRPRLARASGSLALAVALILASNYGLTRDLFISRSGSVFVFARMMQDGIVKRLMDDTCPGSGYRLCAYRNRLKTRADAWLWGPDSGFHALGGFAGKQQEAEDQRIILDSLKRYPLMHLRAAVYDPARCAPIWGRASSGACCGSGPST
jgi:hypothetical protein